MFFAFVGIPITEMKYLQGRVYSASWLSEDSINSWLAPKQNGTVKEYGEGMLCTPWHTTGAVPDPTVLAKMENKTLPLTFQ